MNLMIFYLYHSGNDSYEIGSLILDSLNPFNLNKHESHLPQALSEPL